MYPSGSHGFSNARVLTAAPPFVSTDTMPAGRQGGVNPIKSIRQVWRTACKKAKLVGMIPHDFRRTAVRNLVRTGVPEKVAMMITGHETRSVLDRYHIVTGGDVREGLERLAAVQEPKGPLKAHFGA